MREIRGFTLIEAMVVISIIAILLAIGVPNMRDLLERNAVAGHVNGFVGAVNFSRSEALKRGISIVMCRSSNADTTAAPTCLGSDKNWEGGWIVFADRNGDTQMATASSDVLLRVQGRLTDSGGISQNPASILVFRPTGLMSSGISSITFDSRSLSTQQRRLVCLTIGGRTRLIVNSSDTCE